MGSFGRIKELGIQICVGSLGELNNMSQNCAISFEGTQKLEANCLDRIDGTYKTVVKLCIQLR